MHKFGLFGSAAAAVAMLGMAASAEAQHRGRPRHHDRIDGGGFLLGALLAGGVIAIASAASRADREREAVAEDYDVPPPPPPQDYAEPADGADAGAAPAYPNVADEDDAVDACAAAAEDQGRGSARITHVANIQAVEPAGNGWTVRGTIELSDSYRAEPRKHSFRCAIAEGGAPNVAIEGLQISMR
jgi:hypothetical protein